MITTALILLILFGLLFLAGAFSQDEAHIGCLCIILAGVGIGFGVAALTILYTNY